MTSGAIVCGHYHPFAEATEAAGPPSSERPNTDRVALAPVGWTGSAEIYAPPADLWTPRITVPAADWYTTPPPRRAWLLRDRRTAGSDGVLPLGKVGQLVAEGGGGKTMAMVQLAIAVATGSTWLGALDVASPGRVLAVLGEEDADEVQRRVFNAARASRAPSPAIGMIVTMPLAGIPCAMIERDEFGNPTDAAFLHWLRGYLAEPTETPWRLIIADPLSRLAGLEAEKDNAQATRFIEALESLAVKTGATVLVAHHSNQSSRGAGSKVTATSSRGVTALVDGVRWAATMAVEHVEGLDPDAQERLGEIVTIAFAKSNYSRRGAPIRCRRDLEHGGALVPMDETDEDIVAAAQSVSDPGTRRRAERDEQGRARTAAMGAAVVAALAGHPDGLTYRGLRGAVAASLGGCGDAALAAALANLGPAVRTEPGRNRSTIHYLNGTGT